MLPRVELKARDLVLSDFEVTKNGFLPDAAPLDRLPNAYYHEWEVVAGNLPKLVKARQIRDEIRQLPVLSTTKLHDEEEWRRAYVLLTFMTHAYVWGDDEPAEVSLSTAVHCDPADDR